MKSVKVLKYRQVEWEKTKVLFKKITEIVAGQNSNIIFLV